MTLPKRPAAWLAAGRAHAHRGHDTFFREQVRESGASEALLLIHGFPTSGWDWHQLWPQLTREFPRVIAPDMIGFGFSAKPADYDYSILDQADLHEALLAQLGVTRVHILAHDYGDTVAQELLARYVDRQAQSPLPPGGEGKGDGVEIASCTLLNGGLFPETHHARTVQKLLLTPLGPLLSRLMSRKSFEKSFSAVFGARTQPSAQELDEFWSVIARDGGNRIMHRLIRYIPERRAHRERWVGALQKTSVPLCLINGPDDPVSGAHMVARYREVVGKGEITSLPGIGHYPQAEDPAGVLRAFLEFQAKVAR